MYQNSNFGDKWFYAFITKMEYVSDRATDIFIETDVYQTWLFECNLKDSFVIREHVKDDTIGKHLVDEQLEIGEYTMASYSAVGQLGVNWNVLAVSDNSPFGSEMLNYMTGNIYGNVVTGLTYFPFPNTTQGINWLKNTIKLFTDAGKIDAIVMIFTVPYLLIKATVENTSWLLGDPIYSGDPYGFHMFTESKHLTALDGYIPKNNKMHTYPYKFLYVTNSGGMSANYRYEDFISASMAFIVFGSVMPNPKIMLAPYDYRGTGLKYEYGLTLDGFPMGSWNSDTYAAWLAQNGATAAITLLGSAVTVIGGMVAANPLVVAGGALSIAHELAQINRASIQPDQAKGQVGSGSLMYGTNALDFFFSHMTIKAEFAKRIDNYFTMYGYKVDTLKIPETHSRRYWNYIQTIDVNIEGSIPSEDMERLKKIYNDGVTLWHTTSYFLDYTLDNSII
jgi:hypothetical protein